MTDDWERWNEMLTSTDEPPNLIETLNARKLGRVEYEHHWDPPNYVITEKLVGADDVNHPSHYTDGGIETIDFIESKGFGYRLGNAVKYVSRCGKKDPSKAGRVKDLRKAVWYIEREIAAIEAES